MFDSSDNRPLFSRRLFLVRGAALLSAAGTLPLFLERSGRALAADFAANAQGAGRPDRVLVVVQLGGGNDGLNTVVPITNDHYYKARPRLAVAKDAALRATDDFGFHPAAKGLKQMYDQGRLAVLHAVGYPNHNRSHFRSTDIWSTAEPGRVAQTGWLGRYFDACCSGEDPGKPGEARAAEPSASVALTQEPPTTLQGRKYLPIAFQSPDRLAYRAGKDERMQSAFAALNDVDPEGAEGEAMEPAAMPADPEHRPVAAPAGSKIKIPYGTNGSFAQDVETDQFVQRSALNARVYADNIRTSVSKIQTKATYPNSRLARDLKLVAQMIEAGLPTRVYYVQIGGFDTHSNQQARHPRLMEDLGGALSAFTDDLAALGHLDRTTVMTFSEFGRRVAENGSVGTDHGEAAPLFVMGGAVKPGFHGEAPDLAPEKLSRGDVAYKLDFRRIYSTVLDQWLRADHEKVLGGKFEHLDLFKGA